MTTTERPFDAVVASLLSAVLSRFGEARVQVNGTSMLPAIRPGDIVRIRRVPLASLISGDVVLFGWEGRLLAHRVVSCRFEADPPCLITQGDRHRHADPPVTEGRLLGRVAGIVRHGREAPVPARRPLLGLLVACLLQSPLKKLAPIVRKLAEASFRA